MDDFEHWDKDFIAQLREWPNNRSTPPTTVKQVLECLAQSWNGKHSLNAFGLDRIPTLLWVTIRMEPDSIIAKSDEAERTCPVAVAATQEEVNKLHQPFFDTSYQSLLEHSLILAPATIHDAILRVKPRQNVVYLLEPQERTPLRDSFVRFLVFKPDGTSNWYVLNENAATAIEIPQLTDYVYVARDGDRRILSIEHFVKWLNPGFPAAKVYYSCSLDTGANRHHSVFCFAAFSALPDSDSLSRLQSFADRLTRTEVRKAIAQTIDSSMARLAEFSSETEEWFDDKPGLVVDHWAFNTPAGRNQMKAVLTRFLGNVDEWFSDAATANVVQRALEGVTGVTSRRVSRNPTSPNVTKRPPNAYGAYFLMLLGASSAIQNRDDAHFVAAKRISWAAVDEAELRQAFIVGDEHGAVTKVCDHCFQLGRMLSLPTDQRSSTEHQTIQIREPECLGTSIVARFCLGQSSVASLMKRKDQSQGTVFKRLHELGTALDDAGGVMCLLRDNDKNVLRVALNPFLGAMRILV